MLSNIEVMDPLIMPCIVTCLVLYVKQQEEAVK